MSFSMTGTAGSALFGYAKNNFKLRIFLAAEARVILVGFAVEAAHGFEHADGRCKSLLNRRAVAEKPKRCGNGEQVIRKRPERERKQRPSHDFMPHGWSLK